MSPTDLSFISFIVLIIRRTKQVIYLVKLKAIVCIDKIRSEISKPYIIAPLYCAVRSRPRFKSQC